MVGGSDGHKSRDGTGSAGVVCRIVLSAARPRGLRFVSTTLWRPLERYAARPILWHFCRATFMMTAHFNDNVHVIFLTWYLNDIYYQVIRYFYNNSYVFRNIINDCMKNNKKKLYSVSRITHTYSICVLLLLQND